MLPDYGRPAHSTEKMKDILICADMLEPLRLAAMSRWGEQPEFDKREGVRMSPSVAALRFPALLVLFLAHALANGGPIQSFGAGSAARTA